MKKILNSTVTFWAAFFALFWCCFSILGHMSVTFGYFSRTYLGYYGTEIIVLFLVIPISVLLFYSMMNLINIGKFTFWSRHNVKIWLLTIITIACEYMFACIVYMEIGIISVLVVPFIAYCVGIIWLSRIAYYCCENDKLKNTAWQEFYKQFPINEPIGAMITALIVSVLFFCFTYGNFVFAIVFVVIIFILVKNLAQFSQKNDIKLGKMMEDKIKAEQMKTELVTNVSHDIKTPLTSIINYTDLITSQNLGEQQLKEYTSVINNKSQRLKALIEDLIEASKAGTGNISLDFETINLCEIIGQIAGEYDEQLGKKNIDLILKVPEEPMNISADGRHLWRVLENIFSNAVKYSMEGTRIYADLNEGEGRYTFTLKNVSKEALNISPDELTEQFVRGERSRHTEGSGLGLYIAKSLTQAMGGEFSISISGDMFEVTITFGEEK